MNDDEQIQAFDLPEHCEMDHVVIYEDTDGPNPYYAVPFYLRKVHDDGTEWYDEPTDFDVTDAYFQAVKDHAQMDIDDVKLRRDIPTYELDPL